MITYSLGSSLIEISEPPKLEQKTPENNDKTYASPQITDFHEFKSRFYSKECKVAYLLKKSDQLSFSRFFPDLTLFNSYIRTQPIDKLTKITAHQSVRQGLAFTTFERFDQIFEGNMSKNSVKVHSRDNDCDTDSDVVNCGQRAVLNLCEKGIENCQQIAKKNEELARKFQEQRLRRNQSIVRKDLGKKEGRERPRSQLTGRPFRVTGFGVLHKKNEFWV